MKKKLWILCAAVLAASLPVCAEEEVVDETAVEEATDWSVFLIDDPETYVTLGEYLDLEVTKTVYSVTEEDLEIELDSRLSEYATTETVDRAPEMGDMVTMDISVSAAGDDYEESGFQIEYGYGYLGESFDENLEGIVTGETRTFSVTYDDYAEIEGWENQTVDFEVTVTSIETTVVPELTDEWVAENTDYTTVEEYSDAVTDEVQEEYDRQSDLDAAYIAMSMVMDDSAFHDYPQEMYDAAYNQSLSQYAMMADMFGMTLEDLYDSYGMTEEDLDEEAMEVVNNYLVVNAIAKEEGLTIEEEDLTAYCEGNYADFGYVDAAEMREESDENELTIYALEDKVYAFLLENADLTIEEASSDEEDYYLDDSSALDLDVDDEDWEDWDEEDWEDEDWEDEWEDDTDDMAEIDWADLDIDVDD